MNYFHLNTPRSIGVLVGSFEKRNSLNTNALYHYKIKSFQWLIYQILGIPKAWNIYRRT